MIAADTLLTSLAAHSPKAQPLLRLDASCIYVPAFYPLELLHQLDAEIAWRQDSIKIFGKSNLLPRRTAYYGDMGANYIYSGILNEAQDWTPTLAAIRRHLNDTLGTSFNAVLVNRYADGSHHMGYHTDDESELGRNPVIASLSFGATRRFLVRSRDGKESFGIDLEDRSLLIMAGSFQHHYRHALAKTKRVVGVRINLTFRAIG